MIVCGGQCRGIDFGACEVVVLDRFAGRNSFMAGEDVVHLAGRTARGGRAGLVVVASDSERKANVPLLVHLCRKVGRSESSELNDLATKDADGDPVVDYPYNRTLLRWHPMVEGYYDLPWEKIAGMPQESAALFFASLRQVRRTDQLDSAVRSTD